VITVDNGITAVQEALHAKTLGIDMIITDHHKPLNTIPDAFACINPQCQPNHPFKEVCGAVVASKFCLAIADQLGRSKDRKYQWIMDMIPYLCIATVADCMPLIGENRLIVKQGLDLMSNHKHKLHAPLRTFLNYLNLEQVDTFHI
jgi:single-stranded-DNA-specific exonuclease